MTIKQQKIEQDLAWVVFRHNKRAGERKAREMQVEKGNQIGSQGSILIKQLRKGQ